MIDYIKQNEKVYNKKFSEGWGSHYPDSNLITLYHKYIKGRMSEGNILRVLDFGCGRGTNLEFFDDMGFEVYGIDISSEAIEICKSNKRFHSAHFMEEDIVNNKTISEIFQEKFDVIIATVSLAYLKRADIKNVIAQFYEVLTSEGIVLASFFEEQPAYNQEKDENGMVYTTISNLDINHYTFILKDKAELRNLFHQYKEIVVGETKMIFTDFEIGNTYYIGEKNGAIV